MRDGEQPEILRRYFVAHVAQISRGNAQANAVNSTDLAWSRLVRDQEDGGSNPLAPTIHFTISNLQATQSLLNAWCLAMRSMVQIYFRAMSKSVATVTNTALRCQFDSGWL